MFPISLYMQMYLSMFFFSTLSNRKIYYFKGALINMFKSLFILRKIHPARISTTTTILFKMITRLPESNHFCVVPWIFLSRVQVALCVDRTFM